MAKAVELEKSVDEDNSTSARTASTLSNIPEAREMLLFLSRAMPPEITIDELTADGPADGQPPPYEGIRAGVRRTPAGSRFLIRGTARDLASISRVLHAFEQSEWRIESVRQIDESGSAEPASVGYDFLIAARRDVAS